MKLAEVGRHVGIVGIECSLILEGIAAGHLLVQSETAGKAPP